MNGSDHIGTASEDPWRGISRIERSRLRARGRSFLHELGETEGDLVEKGISLEAAGCLERPHELMPYEITRLQARGKKLAREMGWLK